MANGTFKIVGFGKFWYSLEISAIFVLCLEVSFAGACSVSGLVFFSVISRCNVTVSFLEYLGILSDQTHKRTRLTSYYTGS